MTASLDRLLDNRAALSTDLAEVIDGEVRKQSGLSGAAIRGAHATARKFKPGIVVTATDAMLPGFLGALSPFWDSKPEGTPFGEYLYANGDTASEALLAVTDAQAQTAPGMLAKAYKSVRGKGKTYVTEALPATGAVIEKYAG